MIEDYQNTQKIHQLYVNSNYIIRMSEPDSFTDFINVAGSLLHLIRSWHYLDICLCENCIDDSENLQMKGYPDKMMLVLSREMSSPDKQAGYLFQTNVINLKQLLNGRQNGWKT